MGELTQVDNVMSVGFMGDDSALVAALQSGHPGAPAALFDRYGQHVQRVLANVLGLDPELADLLHEVFAQALKSVRGIKDGERLKAWLTTIAVHTARGCIRSRTRRRWLRFGATEELPEAVAQGVSDEAREAMRSTYELLGALSADLRIPFTLRFIHGMELTDVAESCGVSLATIKRRLAKAERTFIARARREPTLVSWIAEGSRWGRS
ncbi:MAG: RNA polymerase sigma factor [Deltaproteobacteria bacterium]|nr:RNA polymerase sigma factor [Deltaproteobacteria bacterium]